MGYLRVRIPPGAPLLNNVMDKKYDMEIDLRGLTCPLPVIRVKKALEKLEPGQTLHVVATEENARRDLPYLAKKLGHKMLEDYQNSNREFVFVFQRGA